MLFQERGPISWLSVLLFILACLGTRAEDNTTILPPIANETLTSPPPSEIVIPLEVTTIKASEEAKPTPVQASPPEVASSPQPLPPPSPPQQPLPPVHHQHASNHNPSIHITPRLLMVSQEQNPLAQAMQYYRTVAQQQQPQVFLGHPAFQHQGRQAPSLHHPHQLIFNGQLVDSRSVGLQQPQQQQPPLPTPPSTTPQAPQQSSTVQNQVDQAKLLAHQKHQLYIANLQNFYLNSKNSDLLLSVCGHLIPAHRVLVESACPLFEKTLVKLKGDKTVEEPIEIDSIATLISPSTSASQCPDDDLEVAVKTMLKYFYSFDSSFVELPNLNSSLYVWRLAKHFLVANHQPDVIQNEIEPRIVSLLNEGNLLQAHRLFTNHSMSSLLAKWQQYISDHTGPLAKRAQELLTCEEIGQNYDLLDEFVGSLNTSQSQKIAMIDQFIKRCPPTNSTLNIGDFPNSLSTHNCSVDDLKALYANKFIEVEHYVEELEKRVQKREQRCASAQTDEMSVQESRPPRIMLQPPSPYRQIWNL